MISELLRGTMNMYIERRIYSLVSISQNESILTALPWKEQSQYSSVNAVTVLCAR